jgi:hypothetical protein
MLGDLVKFCFAQVYTHMVMEGKVSETVNYDDWINDSRTWMELGHKCSVHGCHSLARDLYGQALLRDADSYRKTKIWYMFSKSCNLCGLSSDAQLSLRVCTEQRFSVHYSCLMLENLYSNH